jgi:hypothetical protein
MTVLENKRGIRWLLINAMTRDQLINFIRRKDELFRKEKLEMHTDDQLRDIAQIIDKRFLSSRRKII